MFKAVPPAKYATEAELCAEFLALVDTKQWTAYAETAGWDILLSRNGDGAQIGIQAKLKFNAHVVTQSLDEYWRFRERGPDYRAVLVPDYVGSNGLGTICCYIGLNVLQVYRDRHSPAEIRPKLPTHQVEKGWDPEWHDWHPTERHILPAYVPDVAAGSSAPIQLTDWKIRALKLGVLIDLRGFVTRGDMKDLGLDHRRWTCKSTGYLKFDEGRGGYVPHSDFPPFSQTHPTVFQQIKADAAKWMTPEMKLRATTELFAQAK